MCMPCIPENVVADSLFDGHACLEKHGKVTYFVRQLMAQHGNGSGETGCEAFAEGSSDGKTIGKVMDAITKNHLT